MAKTTSKTESISINCCELQQNDRLSELPDDVLLSIMSSLTTEEAARASLLSHRWNKLWHRFPKLNLEDCNAFGRFDSAVDVSQKFFENYVCQERKTFVNRVNYVVKHHLGSTLDDFKVTFDINNQFQSDVDMWVVFAFSKQVKRFEFDFTQYQFCGRGYQYTLPLHCCMSSNVSIIKPPLTSLILKLVDVTTEVIDYFLRNFPFLEKLCVAGSDLLTSIRASESQPVPLKHLEIILCRELETIDIFAPNLLAFILDGPSIELNIRNASSLSKVSITYVCNSDRIASAIDPLSTYFSKLEYLCLGVNFLREEHNLTIEQCPPLANLKHLELHFIPECRQSLLGWTRLLEESPVLQKLTLKWDIVNDYPARKIVKRHGCPLKCLKTLEIVGFAGFPVDMEFITYVLENANVLQEVIADPTRHGVLERAMERAKELERIIPEGVKFIFKIPQKKKKSKKKRKKGHSKVSQNNYLSC